MNLEEDCVVYMKRLDSEMFIEMVWVYLGWFGLFGEFAIKSIKVLFGG